MVAEVLLPWLLKCYCYGYLSVTMVTAMDNEVLLSWLLKCYCHCDSSASDMVTEVLLPWLPGYR